MMTDPLESAVVIVGAPRSGTTILGQLLGAHPDACFVREPRLVWRTGNDFKSDLLRPEDARPGVRTRIRRDLRRYVDASGAARLVEKTPSNALRLGFVDRVLPGCRIVHILRDGRDAVPSIRDRWRNHTQSVSTPNERTRLVRRLKEMSSPRQAFVYGTELARRVLPFDGAAGSAMWGPRLPAMRPMLKELELIEIAALQWRTCVEQARSYGAQLPSDRYMEVRLEELDRAMLDRILAFADLAAAPQVSEAFDARFDRDRRPSKRALLTADEQRRMQTWIGPTQAWLGYE